MNKQFLTSLVLVLVAGWMYGCGSTAGTGPAGSQQASAPDSGAAAAKTAAAHDHSGWWCAEHGVPEEVCGQCSSQAAAAFQKKGDWCREHNRPDSQCFLCHPELEAKFAALYEAKYGKQPPRPEG